MPNGSYQGPNFRAFPDPNYRAIGSGGGPAAWVVLPAVTAPGDFFVPESRKAPNLGESPSNVFLSPPYPSFSFKLRTASCLSGAASLRTIASSLGLHQERVSDVAAMDLPRRQLPLSLVSGGAGAEGCSSGNSFAALFAAGGGLIGWVRDLMDPRLYSKFPLF